MVERCDALQYLKGVPRSFDIVFLDPPFATGLLAAAAQTLAAGGWLVPGARLYAECPARPGPPPLPAAFELLKSKRAGEVGYHLYEYLPAPPTDQT